MLQSMGSQRVGHDWMTEQQQRPTDHACSLSSCPALATLRPKLRALPFSWTTLIRTRCCIFSDSWAVAHGLGIWSSAQEMVGWYIKDTLLWSHELCKAIARAHQDIYKPVLMPCSHDSGWSNMAHQLDSPGSQHHYWDPSRDWTLPSCHCNLRAPNMGLHLHGQEGLWNLSPL